MDNTLQSNNADGHGANLKADRSVTLAVNSGIQFDELYWSLRFRRDHLSEQAAFELAGRDVENYVSTLNQIDHVSEMMDSLFFGLNSQYTQFAELRAEIEVGFTPAQRARSKSHRDELRRQDEEKIRIRLNEEQADFYKPED